MLTARQTGQTLAAQEQQQSEQLAGSVHVDHAGLYGGDCMHAGSSACSSKQAPSAVVRIELSTYASTDIVQGTCHVRSSIASNGSHVLHLRQSASCQQV